MSGNDPGASSGSSATYKVSVEGEGVSINREIDAETAMAVIELVVAGGSNAVEPASKRATGAPRKRRKARHNGGDGARARKGKRRRSASPGIAKDLSLRPKSKVSFADFVAEKSPNSHYEKQVVIVAWLTDEAQLSEIGIDHINTCYQAAGWKRPKDLENNLQITASRKGWLDTNDMSNITITIPGEDFVKHELPPKAKSA